MSHRFKKDRYLKKSENMLAKYSSIIDGNLIGIFIIQNKKLVYVNKYIEKCFGYTTKDLYAMDWLQLISEENHNKVINILKKLHSGNHNEIFYDIKGVKKNGSEVYLLGNVKNIFFRGAPAIIGVLLNVTKYKKSENKMREMALTDLLTGVPNRNFLKLHLNYLLKNHSRDNKIALLFIDLDRFKIINDTLGHNFGDIVLKHISQKIMESLGGVGILFRFAGDEFVVVLENTSVDKAEKTAGNIIQAMSDSLTVEGMRINITSSIGISLFPDDANDVDSLIKHADIAMYEAKYRGRNNYVFYDRQMGVRVELNLKIETALRKALQNNELSLSYQPIIEVSTGKIYAAEALLRWNSNELGMVMPDDFIPVAENTDLIVPIGEWVLKTACNQYAAWKNSGISLNNILVNISYKQLIHDGFIESLLNIINEYGLKKQSLELELTESIFRDGEILRAVLTQLHSNGFKIAVDDFGVGYSSMSLLKHISINNLKIDRSFIKEMLSSEKVSELVKGIINIGKNLNYSVIAEGIETREQFDFIKKHKCDFAQGFYFSKPLEAREFEKFYRSWNPSSL